MSKVFAVRRTVLEPTTLTMGPDFSFGIMPPAARFILRGDGNIADSVGNIFFGAPLPQKACRATEVERRTAMWLGPDEWLLIAEDEDAAKLFGTLEGSVERQPHSLVDVSHRQIGLIAQGRCTARVISAGCPLELSLGAFPVNMAVRTILAKAEIVLRRRSDDQFHIEVWRSFANYVSAFLAEAARGAPAF
jgi:sarcosine oxidase subunit gamma